MFKSYHPLYKTWQGMINRCYYKRSNNYHLYGGRGIEVCERWLNDFFAFAEDMGERPEGYTLDRINNDGNYEPSNCRWATRKEQNRNRRNSKGVTVHGEFFKSIAECAEKYGINRKILAERLRAGDSPERAVRPNLGPLYKPIEVTYNGKTYRSLGHIARELDLPRRSLTSNLKKFGNIEEAIKHTKKKET